MTDASLAVQQETPQQAAAEPVSARPVEASLIHNIPVPISVVVGRAVLKISDLLRLSQGSVVELDRIAGEPIDLLVQDTVVAQGEVVLVNERYGIRLTRVVTAAERLKNL